MRLKEPGQDMNFPAPQRRQSSRGNNPARGMKTDLPGRRVLQSPISDVCPCFMRYRCAFSQNTAYSAPGSHIRSRQHKVFRRSLCPSWRNAEKGATPFGEPRLFYPQRDTSTHQFLFSSRAFWIMLSSVVMVLLLLWNPRCVMIMLVISLDMSTFEVSRYPPSIEP